MITSGSDPEERAGYLLEPRSPWSEHVATL